MEFNAGAITVGTHRRIHLCQFQINGCHLRKGFRNGSDDTTCHMLQQPRRNIHLALDQSVERSIVERIGHLVTLHGLSHRIANPQTEQEVTSHLPFLCQHPVEGMETNVLKMNIRIPNLHSSLLPPHHHEHRVCTSSKPAPHRSSRC